MERRLALMRRPSPQLMDGVLTYQERQPVDAGLAERQWEAYRETFHRHGWETVEAPPAPDCPDSAFIEDTMVVYCDLAVLGNSAVPERQAELAGAEEAVRSLGYRVARIEGPATLDGGDVLKFGGTVSVGLGGRTNEAAMHQLRDHIAPLGAHVVGVALGPVLHLKSAVTALPDGTIVGHDAAVDGSIWPMYEEVPEPSGAHVVLLGPRAVLMAADAPRSAQMFRERGLTVEEVDISEFQKLEGTVTCLSVRLRGWTSR